jgi:hypothetical protein
MLWTKGFLTSPNKDEGHGILRNPALKTAREAGGNGRIENWKLVIEEGC